MTSFLIIDDHPLFRDALGNAIRLAVCTENLNSDVVMVKPAEDRV
jgi:hypothetical protein